MRFAVVLLLFFGTGIASADVRSEAVDALPQIAKVTRGRATVIVRGNIPKARHAEMTSLVDQIVSDATRRFSEKTTTATAHPVVTLCLFTDAASYAKTAGVFGKIPSDLGFYLPDVRVAFANIGISIGNLRHELAHPMVDDEYPTIPAWLGEGVGSLYGTARWANGRFEFLVNYRLRDLQRAQKAGTLPALAELAASTSREVHGPDGMVYYALARYVLLYAEQQGTLEKLYAELRTGGRASHAKILAKYIDEKAFLGWVKKLRY